MSSADKKITISELTKISYENVLSFDDTDPLAAQAKKFKLPDNLIYLDGNSLGAMPKTVPAYVEDALLDGWATQLITSWNNKGWHNLPFTLADRLAPMMGAKKGEVLLVDSTSLNLFKTLVAALKMRPDRSIVISEKSNFPSDIHIVQGVLDNFFPEKKLELSSAGDEEIISLIDNETAVVTLTHVDYKTGEIRNMEKITKAAHKFGALVIWDLSHSLGALPLDLNDCDVDFAIGCTYKYLNGGHGAPAYLFVAEKHLKHAKNTLTGWMGHASPFGFDINYEPAETIEKFRCGTPAILSYLALEKSLDIFETINMQELREKSQNLSQLFIKLIEQKCANFDLKLISPRNPEMRGSQISLTHSNSWEIMQALIDHNVIGDFRAPNIIRFGFTPLYTSYKNVWNAVTILQDIIKADIWKDPKYAVRKLVT